jgi:hypothetical protein
LKLEASALQHFSEKIKGKLVAAPQGAFDAMVDAVVDALYRGICDPTTKGRLQPWCIYAQIVNFTDTSASLQHASDIAKAWEAFCDAICDEADEHHKARFPAGMDGASSAGMGASMPPTYRRSRRLTLVSFPNFLFEFCQQIENAKILRWTAFVEPIISDEAYTTIVENRKKATHESKEKLHYMAGATAATILRRMAMTRRGRAAVVLHCGLGKKDILKKGNGTALRTEANRCLRPVREQLLLPPGTTWQLSSVPDTRASDQASSSSPKGRPRAKRTRLVSDYTQLFDRGRLSPPQKKWFVLYGIMFGLIGYGMSLEMMAKHGPDLPLKLTEEVAARCWDEFKNLLKDTLWKDKALRCVLHLLVRYTTFTTVKQFKRMKLEKSKSTGTLRQQINAVSGLAVKVEEKTSSRAKKGRASADADLLSGGEGSTVSTVPAKRPWGARSELHIPSAVGKKGRAVNVGAPARGYERGLTRKSTKLGPKGEAPGGSANMAHPGPASGTADADSDDDTDERSDVDDEMDEQEEAELMASRIYEKIVEDASERSDVEAEESDLEAYERYGEAGSPDRSSSGYSSSEEGDEDSSSLQLIYEESEESSEDGSEDDEANMAWGSGVLARALRWLG